MADLWVVCKVQPEQWFVVVSADSYCLLFSHKKTNIGLACVWLRCLLSLVPRTAPLAFLFFLSLESMLKGTLKLKPTLPLCICVTMKSASSERRVICKQPLSKPVPIVFVLKGYDLNSSLMEPMFPLGAFELLDIDLALHTPHTELKHSSSNYSQE